MPKLPPLPLENPPRPPPPTEVPLPPPLPDVVSTEPVLDVLSPPQDVPVPARAAASARPTVALRTDRSMLTWFRLAAMRRVVDEHERVAAAPRHAKVVA